MTAPEFVPTISTAECVAALNEAVVALQTLDGKQIPTAAWGRSKSGEMALLTRELLRIDHMLNRAKVLVMDEYWYVKDPETPTERASQ